LGKLKGFTRFTYRIADIVGRNRSRFRYRVRQIVRELVENISVDEIVEMALRVEKEHEGKNDPFISFEEYLGTSEVARILNVSDTTVRYWCDKGKIRYFKNHRGYRRIPRKEVEKLLYKLKTSQRIKLSKPISEQENNTQRNNKMVINQEKVKKKKNFLLQLFIFTLYSLNKIGEIRV